MPRFEEVQPRGGLSGAMPVPQASPGAFGAATARSLARLGGVLTDLGVDRLQETQKLRREREITERSTSLARRLQAARDEMRRLTDPDAVTSLRDEVLQDLDGSIGEVGDAVVQEALRRQFATWGTAFAGDAADHLFGIERDRGRASTREALETYKSLAVTATDPATRVAAERAYDVAAGQAVSLGLFRDEEMGTIRRADRSQMHVLTLEAMLDRGQDQAAAAYVADPHVRAELLAEDLVKADKMTTAGTFLGRVQRHEDAIYAKHLNDREGALAEARQITNAEERKATVQALHVRFDEATRIEAEQQADAFMVAQKWVDGGQPLHRLSAHTRNQLSISQIQALETWEDHRRRGREPVNDDQLYLAFGALTPEQVAAIPEGKLWETYHGNLDRAHWERVQATWTQAREAKRTKLMSPELSATLTFKDRVDNAFRGSGILSDRAKKATAFTTDEAARYARFEAAAARAVEHFELTQLGGKRKATGEEIQQLVNGLLVQTVFVDEWGTDPERPAVLVTEDERGETYVPVGRIPPAHRRTIVNLARSFGVVGPEVSDADAARRLGRRLERAYAASLLDASDAEIRAILTGEQEPPPPSFPVAP